MSRSDSFHGFFWICADGWWVCIFLAAWCMVICSEWRADLLWQWRFCHRFVEFWSLSWPSTSLPRRSWLLHFHIFVLNRNPLQNYICFVYLHVMKDSLVLLNSDVLWVLMMQLWHNWWYWWFLWHKLCDVSVELYTFCLKWAFYVH